MINPLKMLPLLSKLKSLPVLLTVAFLSGAGVTAYSLNVYHKAELADELTASLKQEKQAVTDAIIESDRIRALDQKYYEKEVADVKKLKATIKYVEKEVPKYVPENESCNYRVGAVGMLNLARRPDLEEQLMSEAAKLSDEALNAITTHSQLAEIQSNIQCAERYNELAASHDKLVDYLMELENKPKK